MKHRVLAFLRVAGVGGGDQRLLRVLRACPTAACTDLFVQHPIDSMQQLSRVREAAGIDGHFGPPRIHQIAQPDGRRLPGVHYHIGDGDLKDDAMAAAASADVCLSWFWASPPARHLGLPVVEPITGQSPAMLEHAATAARYADALVCVSGAIAEMVPAGAPTTVISSAADPARVAPAMGREATRRNWQITDRQKCLLWIGRLEAGKNPTALVQAIAALPAEWVGIIIGGGSQRSSVEREASAFAPGRIAICENNWLPIGDALAAADCLLLNSDAEGDPAVVHEANLAGVPVVATDFSVFAEHARQHRYSPAVTVPPRATPSQLADAVLRATVATNAATIARAQRVVWEHFTTNSTSTLWGSLFESVVSESRRDAIAPLIRVVGGSQTDVPVRDERQTLRPVQGPVHIHVVYDTDGWAFHHSANALQEAADGMDEVELTTAIVPSSGADLILLLDYSSISKMPADVPVATWMDCGPDRLAELYEQVLQHSIAVLHSNVLHYQARSQRHRHSYYAPKGVDCDLFHPMVPIADRARRVLWLGSEYHRQLKGHDLMTAIESRLVKNGMELDAQVVDSHNPPRTLLQMAEWYNTGSIYVVASDSEGTPNGALEAMACGVPVVATQVGVCPQLVCHGRNGYLLRKRTPQHIYAAIAHCMDRRDTMSREARETALQWQWRDKARRVLSLLVSIARGSPPPAGSLDGTLDPG